MKPKWNKYRSAKPKNWKESYGESIVRKWLKKNRYKFKQEVVFLDLPWYRFDFYIPKYRIVIEYDGAQHSRPIEAFGGLAYYKKRKRYDNIKGKFVWGHEMKLIRIKHYDNIEEKLEEKFKKYT